MNRADKLKKLELLSELFLKDEHTTAAEVGDALKVVVDGVAKVRENIEGQLSDHRLTSSQEHSKLHTRIDDTHTRIEHTAEALAAKIETIALTPGKDGKDANEEAIVEKLLETIKLPEQQAELQIVRDTSEDIRNKLELLQGDDRLDASAIRNLPTIKESDGVTRVIAANRPFSSLIDVNMSGLTAGQYPKWDGVQWVPGTPSGGGGAGTVTNVSSANTDIGVANQTTTPVLTLNSGIGANQIPKLDASGQLGIGTASPQTLLHLKNTSGSNGLTIENTTANGKAFFYVTDNFVGTNFAEFDVNSSGTAGTNILTMPNAMVLRTGAGTTNGMYLLTQNSSASMKFATGGFATANVRMTLDSTGGLTLTSLTNGIVKSTSGLLSNAVAGTDYSAGTAALATGILKSTTTSGALSIATGADLPVMTNLVGGAVPTPPNNTTTFLRGDGTWASPPAGGSGITRSVNVISTSQTAGATALTDYVYLVSGTITLTLPTAVGNTNRYTIIHTDTNTLTIATTSSQTIAFYPAAPATTATVTVQGTVVELFSDGANWWTI